MISAATATMGMITAIAVLPAGESPELCEACLVGLRLVEDVPEAVGVCWLPLPEDVMVTTAGGVVPWLGVCVTTDVNTCVEVGTGAVVIDVVTGGGAASVDVAGVMGVVVGSTDVGDVAGAEAEEAGVVGEVPSAEDMMSKWELVEKV
jgi:hypothetical protein